MKKHPIPIVHYISGFIAIVGLWGAFLVPNAYASEINNYIQANLTSVIDYYTDTDENFGTGSANIGYSGSSNSEISLRYVPAASHDICTVAIGLAAVGSPTDSVALNVTYWGIDSAALGPTLDATMHTEGTELKSADASFQVRSTSTPYTVYEYTFTPCLTVIGANRYNFNFYRTGTLSTTNYYSYSSVSVASGGYSTGKTFDTTKQATYRGWSSTGTVNSWPSEGVYPLVAFLGSDNFGAFQASTTTSYSPSACTPPNSILDVGGGVSYSLCYMFVPSQAVFDQWADISDLLATKIPFSYVYSIETAVNDISLTTSSSSFPLISIPLSTVASSTVTGVIPDIELSTSTISTYLTPTFHNALYALLIAAIWLNVGWLFFREAMRIFKS